VAARAERGYLRHRHWRGSDGSVAENTLLIVPGDPYAVPRAIPALLVELHEQGLLGAALGDNRFAAGEAYARLVSFLGCSPYFKTEPEHPGDRDYCHVEVRGPWARPRLIGRLDEAAPRCPHCRQTDRQWRHPTVDGVWTCPHCGGEAPWRLLNWRRRAAFARFALALYHVFEGEAVPGPDLLKTLAAHATTPWSWCYG